MALEPHQTSENRGLFGSCMCEGGKGPQLLLSRPWPQRGGIWGQRAWPGAGPTPFCYSSLFSPRTPDSRLLTQQMRARGV